MLGYDDVAVFLAVAREGGFSAAARKLGLPVSTVSRRIAALERTLKTPLLRRTTRAVSLTDDGRAFAERCAAAYDEVAAAAEALGDAARTLRGTLRVTAPHHVCNDLFAAQLLDFAAGHPDLLMDLRLTNGAPDLVEEGVDLAFQLGPLKETGHVARRLWDVPYVLCASPGLIARRPALAALAHPRDLAAHACVLTRPIGTWPFEGPGGQTIAFVPRALGAALDDLSLGHAAVRRGLGVGYLPLGLVASDLAQGALVALDIAGWRLAGRELYAVYPASRQLSAKVRATIDFALAARAAHATAA